jgi:hypothetical protein
LSLFDSPLDDLYVGLVGFNCSARFVSDAALAGLFGFNEFDRWSFRLPFPFDMFFTCASRRGPFVERKLR